MLRHPVQDCVGDDEVRVGRGRPVGDVAAARVEPPRAGGGDHLRRAVEGLDHGVGPARGEQGREVPRPAAQVDDPARRPDGDPVQQVVEGPGAVVVEGEVRGGVPGGAHHVRQRPDDVRAATLRDQRRIRAGVRTHLQHRAVAPRHLALDEPRAPARQVAVVPAADRALDPGVDDLGHAPGVDEAEPPGRAIGEQHGGRPVVGGELSTSSASTTVSAPLRHTARLTRCQPTRRTPSPSGSHRPHDVTTRWPPSAVRATASTRSSASSRPGNPSGSPSPPSRRRSAVRRRHRDRPIAFSRNAIRYCSSGTRSPNSSRYVSASSTGLVRCSRDLISAICSSTIASRTPETMLAT